MLFHHWWKIQARSSYNPAGDIAAGETFNIVWVRRTLPKWIAFTLVLCSWSCLNFAQDNSNDTFEFDIPQQRADLALIAFAEQANQTLLFSFDETSTKTSNKLHGQYEVVEALRVVLADTGLSISMGGEGQLSVVHDTHLNSGNNVNKIIRRSVVSRLSSAVGALIIGGGALAEEVDGVASSQINVIEEIVVTAMKHSQSIQEIPASITAIGGQDLEDRGIRDMHDIKFATPSLQYGSVLGGHNISIRGIGSFNRQPGVAVSVDGVYQTKDTAAQMYQLDLERIEIARGPQGTLYGRNSNGGVVNMITVPPTQNHEGYVRVGYAEFDEMTFQGVYSGPISDRVAVRIALDHKDMGDGWIENKVPGSEDLMQGDATNGRIRLIADLLENLAADFTYSRGTSDGPQDQYEWITDNRAQAEALNPGISAEPISLEAFETYSDFPTGSDREYELASLALNWELGWGELKSITALQDFDDRFDNDRDATGGGYVQTSDRSSTESFTQEFVLLGESDNFSWTLGAYYLDEEYTRNVHFDSTRPAVGLPAPYILDFSLNRYDTTSLSFFADATWNVTDSFRLSAGVRHTSDEIDESHVNQVFLQIPDPVLIVESCNKSVDEEWDETTYRLAAQYDLSDRTNIYGSYSQGYKVGGVALFECSAPYDPETVDAFEIGYKARFGAGSTTLTAALFSYDYSDFQVAQVIGLASVTRNAGDAEVLGFELEFSSYLTDRWLLSGGMTLLDTQYDDFINFDGLNPAAGFQNLKGNALNDAPETSINMGVQYSMPAFAGELSVRVDTAYRSRVYFREFGARDDSQSGYAVINVNAGWKSNDGVWEARLFAKNATEEEYLVSLLGVASTGGRFGAYGPPRQVGLEITRRFGEN